MKNKTELVGFAFGYGTSVGYSRVEFLKGEGSPPTVCRDLRGPRAEKVRWPLMISEVVITDMNYMSQL